MSLVLFVHILGTAMWIGGTLASLVVVSTAQDETGPVKAGAFRIVARLHTMVIGFGALLVLGSGVILTMALDTEGLGDLMRDPKLWVMILTGIVAGLIVLFVGLPTASRLGALAVASENGALPPALEIYRKRLGVLTMISGTLAVLSLLAWYVF